MPDEPIAALTARTPVVEGADSALRCEFCGTSLTKSGEALKLSDRARDLRALEDRYAVEVAAHQATKGELVAAAQKVAELEALIAAKNAPAAIDSASPWGGR